MWESGNSDWTPFCKVFQTAKVRTMWFRRRPPYSSSVRWVYKARFIHPSRTEQLTAGLTEHTDVQQFY